MTVRTRSELPPPQHYIIYIAARRSMQAAYKHAASRSESAINHTGDTSAVAMPARMLATALAAPQTTLASITAFGNETATLTAAKTVVTAMACIQHFIIGGFEWC